MQNILFDPCCGDNNLACQIAGTPNDCTAAPMFGNSRSLGEKGMRSSQCPIIVKMMKKKNISIYGERRWSANRYREMDLHAKFSSEQTF